MSAALPGSAMTVYRALLERDPVQGDLRATTTVLRGLRPVTLSMVTPEAARREGALLSTLLTADELSDLPVMTDFAGELARLAAALYREEAAAEWGAKRRCGRLLAGEPLGQAGEDAMLRVQAVHAQAGQPLPDAFAWVVATASMLQRAETWGTLQRARVAASCATLALHLSVRAEQAEVWDLLWRLFERHHAEPGIQA